MMMQMLMMGGGALAASLVAGTYESTYEGSATAGVTFGADGVTIGDSVTGPANYNWKTGGGTGADYEIRWTSTSGTLTGGLTSGTWYALSSDRYCYVTAANPLGAIKTCTGTVEIRIAGGGETLASASITLRAVAEASGP